MPQINNNQIKVIDITSDTVHRVMEVVNIAEIKSTKEIIIYVKKINDPS
jgi:hypothetical protein